MKRIILAVTTLAMFGCADFQTTLNNTPPSQVQADIVALGAVAKPYVTPAVAAKLHAFAVQVVSVNNYAQLIQILPHTGNAATDKLISSITLYVTKGGPYVTAVSQGILANF